LHRLHGWSPSFGLSGGKTGRPSPPRQPRGAHVSPGTGLNRSAGVLLTTHESAGEGLTAAARQVMPHRSLKVTLMDVHSDADVGDMREVTSHHIRQLDQGDGVLVLSDLYGATPCNIGLAVGDLGAPVRCVSGLNLPMLLRVMNYADKSLDELAEIAAAGGRGGIFIDHA